MTKTDLLNTLKSDCFYRFYLNKAVTNEQIKIAIEDNASSIKKTAPLFQIEKIGSDYRYIYINKNNWSIRYHGQLKGCNIEKIKKGIYTIDFYYKADNGQDTITAKVLYIMQNAI